MLGSTANLRVRFEPEAISYSSRNATVRMRFVQAHAVKPEGIVENGRLHVVHGNDPRWWRQDAPLYGKVRYRGLYDGIDLVYGGTLETIKSEYLVAPGADASRIRMHFEEGTRTRFERGELWVSTAGGTFRESAPEAFQEGEAGRSRIAAAYHRFDDGSIGFEIGGYDRARPLVIDPTVSFSTFWGGSLMDAITGVAAGADGSTYVCGWTSSSDVSTLSSYQKQRRGSDDGFVLKLSAAHAIVYATYLGGSGQDHANAIAVDAAGNAYIGGWTSSADFPLAGAVQSVLRGSRDGFVTKLNASGGVVFSTYLGGSGTDAINAIQADSSGFTYAAGQTTSTDFPTACAFQSRFGGTEDAFVTKLDAYGRFLYSTYLGGAGADEAYGVAVLSGQAYVTGATSSYNFPVLNAFLSTNRGGQDAFVAKLSSTGSALVYSTYLGGNAGSPGWPEIGYAIAVTGAGEAVVAGTTYSSNFPTLAPVRSALTGTNNDAFVSKLTAAGNQLVFSTYLGGTGYDAVKSVALDGAGNIYVAGETTSRDMQVVNPVQTSNAGTYNALLASLTADGKTLRFASYWGGGASDSAAGVAVDGSGNVVVGGSTTSWNFPLVNPIQTFNGSNNGGFVATFALQSLPRIGIYNTGHWIQYFNNGQNFWFGIPGDVPVLGDWDGSGKVRIGIYRSTGEWFVDLNGNNQWDGESIDRTFWFGLPGDVPVVGDWDGSGRLKIGIYRTGQWFLDKNGNFAWDSGDICPWFGLPGDIPVVGDWDGTGRLRIGVYRQGQWFVDLNGNFQWDGDGIDASFWFGTSTDVPVIADWDGTGRLRIGTFHNGVWHADLNGNHIWDGPPNDAIFSFGSLGDTPVSGKW